MPRRKYVLATDETYHVFNRSVGREEIFTDKRTINRFLDLIDYYRYPQSLKYSHFTTLAAHLQKSHRNTYTRQKPLVGIFAFTLMPNHFHFLIKQEREKGISIFTSNVQNGFAKYFNIKNDRHGTLLQNPFKARRVETDEELVHISRYIHLNPVTGFLIEFEKLAMYPLTSFSTYLGNVRHPFVDTKTILGNFSSVKKYAQFVSDQADYQRKLSIMKHLLLE